MAHADQNSYLRFLRFCLDEDAPAPTFAKEMDWMGLLRFGMEQSIEGVLFYGISRLNGFDYGMDRRTIAKWYGYAMKIEADNRQANKDTAAVTRRLTAETGAQCVVLKGQANALRYPKPAMRSPGDVDLWTTLEPADAIIWAKSRDTKSETGYHHVTMNALATPVEIHFVPSFMGNLFYEWRLRKYFRREKERQFQRTAELPEGLGTIGILQDDFDCIFQLSHLMHHFFFEGIGLRQFVDFYYLLKNGFTDEEKARMMKTVRWLNMRRFCAAVMYVLRDVLGLPPEFLLCQPDERRGKQLLAEILKAGNFGFYDKRYSFANMSTYRQYPLEIYRNLHFALDYPSETVWGRPVSRWWHAIYKAWLRRQVRRRENR